VSVTLFNWSKTRRTSRPRPASVAVCLLGPSYPDELRETTLEAAARFPDYALHKTWGVRLCVESNLGSLTVDICETGALRRLVFAADLLRKYGVVK